VVHCDLKPSNILLDKTLTIAKIGDVGLSRAMNNSRLSTRSMVFGTLAYAAPEVLTAARCTEKVIPTGSVTCLCEGASSSSLRLASPRRSTSSAWEWSCAR
jgi:serine/threonine protein kinase